MTVSVVATTTVLALAARLWWLGALAVIALTAVAIAERSEQ